MRRSGVTLAPAEILNADSRQVRRGRLAPCDAGDASDRDSGRAERARQARPKFRGRRIGGKAGMALTREAAEAHDRLPRRERIRLAALSDHIEVFPFTSGMEHPGAGRKSHIHRGTFGKWTVTWRVDFPMEEIHILDLSRMNARPPKIP